MTALKHICRLRIRRHVISKYRSYAAWHLSPGKTDKHTTNFPFPRKCQDGFIDRPWLGKKKKKDWNWVKRHTYQCTRGHFILKWNLPIYTRAFHFKVKCGRIRTLKYRPMHQPAAGVSLKSSQCAFKRQKKKKGKGKRQRNASPTSVKMDSVLTWTFHSNLFIINLLS